jgi:hypothetical protein
MDKFGPKVEHSVNRAIIKVHLHNMTSYTILPGVCTRINACKDVIFSNFIIN